MRNENSLRWTPRRVLRGVLRRCRSALSATGALIGEKFSRLRRATDPERPEVITRGLKLRGWSRISLLGSGPAVSLTSYGVRVSDVHLTIESIARGKVRPRALYLWLDDARLVSDPPPALRRLVRRGLTLRHSPDYGPHKKYYPYLLISPLPEGPLATADDDVLYPSTWLESLGDAHTSAPHQIHGFRARRVTLRDGGLAPYLEWPLSNAAAASPLNFMTGVSGVIYPREFLLRLQEQGDGFRDTCPRADDVWLHRWAVEYGFDVHQIVEPGVHDQFPLIPGSQEVTLTAVNVVDGGNDRQIAATYPPELVERLHVVAAAAGEA